MKTALALLIATAGRALADDRADADRLFVEGRALIEAKQPELACAKFRESYAKDSHALGTLLNLGLCNERQGKIATAIVLYREAIARATSAKLDESRNAAQERLDALLPSVPELTITIAGSMLAGERLRVDDRVVAAGTIPLDPGEHELLLTAPDRVPYRTSVRTELGTHSAIVLPELQPTSARKMIGKITVATGAGLVAIAAVAIAVARHDYAVPFDAGHCTRGVQTCDASGQHDVDSARSLGTIGSVIGIVGLATLAGGAALWLTAPHAETAIVPTGTGVAIVGRF